MTAPKTHRRRLTSAASAFAALTLAAPLIAGCAPQAEEDDAWSRAGVGVNVENGGPLIVRNALIVADDEGEAGSFIAAAVNDTDDDLTLSVSLRGEEVVSVEVPARSTVSFGEKEGLTDPPVIEDLDSAPGTVIDMEFQSGDAEPATHSVQVFDDSLGYLDGLEPQ